MLMKIIVDNAFQYTLTRCRGMLRRICVLFAISYVHFKQMWTNALKAQTNVTRTRRARTHRAALSARVMPAIWGMVSVATVRINSLDP